MMYFFLFFDLEEESKEFPNIDVVESLSNYVFKPPTSVFFFSTSSSPYKTSLLSLLIMMPSSLCLSTKINFIDCHGRYTATET